MKCKLLNSKSWRSGIYSVALLLLVVTSVAFYRPIIQAGTDTYAEIRRFIVAINSVRELYVDEVDPEVLVDGAIVGMLSKLDPHCVYIPPEQLKQISTEFEGYYSGIGIEFVIQDHYPTVVAPIPDTPAERLHLRPGDVIVKIDDVSTYGMKESEVMEKFRGEEGSLVRLTIKRLDFDELLTYNVILDRVPIRSVLCSFMIDQEIGYLRLGRFAKTTQTEVTKAILNLEAQHMKKLVFDLRSNSGGYLDQAVAVADLFLPAGRKIVYTRGRSSSANEEFYATDSTPDRNYPVVVLINHGTASAAEVLSGALQDWDRAVIVGETSFGKGLVQNQIPLKNGSAIRVTIARYYTPSGRLIQRPFDQGFSDYFQQGLTGDGSVKAAEAKKEVFTTFSGRKVYGGGGINPDIECKMPKLTATLAKLEAKMLFFDFATHFASEVAGAYPQFPVFLKSYQVDNAVLQQLITFLQDKKFTINTREFASDRAAIQQEIKAEFARKIWGNDQFYRTRLDTDPQFQAAVAAFPLAEKLAVLSSSTKANR